MNSKIFAALLALLLAAAFRLPAEAAGTPAGTVIRCWAEATYTNTRGTLQGQSTSNVIALTVARVCAATISAGVTSAAANPGESVSFPLTLRNTGNAPDSFGLLATAPSGWSAQIYRDDNGDGVQQSGEQIRVAVTPSLAADAIYTVIVKVTLPTSASAGPNAPVTFLARSSGDSSLLVSQQLSVKVNPPLDVALASDPPEPPIGTDYTLSLITDPPQEAAVSLSVLAPDGAVQTRTLTTGSDGKGALSLAADISGDWTVTASWTDPLSGAPQKKSLVVPCKGPEYVARGLDMLSIPMTLANSSPASLFGAGEGASLAKWLPDKKGYAAYNPAANRLDAGIQQLQTGHGYYFWSAEPVTIAPQGRIADQKAPFALSLPAGWNQIGSPYLSASSWGQTKVVYSGRQFTLAQAKSAGLMLDYAYKMVRKGTVYGYALLHPHMSGANATLEPWRGVWVYLAKPAQLVLAPPSDTAEDVTIEPPADPYGWLVQIVSRSGEAIDSASYFGVSADTGLYALANPPRPAYYEDVYFPAAFASKGIAGPYASDIRSSVGDTASWSFEVAGTNTTLNHTLTWLNVSEIPDGYSVTLRDLVADFYLDMRATSSYTYKLPAGGKPARFRVDLVKMR